MMITLKKAFVITLLLASNFSIAEPLKGVKEVGILIESLDDDARKCNITESLLESSLRIRLANSNLKIVSMDRFPNGYLYVNVNTLDDKDFCIAAVSTSFNKYISSERGTGNFWSSTELLSIRKINISKRIGETIDNQAKLFLGAWLKANQN